MSVSGERAVETGVGAVDRRRRRWSEAQKRQIVAETLQAARRQPLVQNPQFGHLRDRHHELAPRRLHQRLDLALVVALAGPAEAVAEQVVRLKMRERPGALTGAVAQDPRHRQRRVVF